MNGFALVPERTADKNLSGACAGTNDSNSPLTRAVKKCPALPFGRRAESYGEKMKRITEILSDGWKFARISGDFSSPSFDDSGWRDVRVPHDHAIAGPFSDKNEPVDFRGKIQPGKTGGLPCIGEAWYRLRFELDDSPRRTFFEFDGAMSGAVVYVNGVEAGAHWFGYAPFSVEATAAVHAGANILAVKLDHPANCSRWYSGAGLFREVRMVRTAPDRIAEKGLFVFTQGDAANARVHAKVTLDASKPHTVVLTLRGPGGETLGRKVPADAGEAVFEVEKPQLWDLHTLRPIQPLYTMTATLCGDGMELDDETVKFGIRTLSFGSDGFRLNGRLVKWNGVCMHHDLGLLGAAARPAGIRRQLELLMKIGVNAIRTSHNPPSPHLLRLCDEFGILVLAEAFDEWRIPKVKDGYASHFDADADRDLTSLVRMGRNHPSVMAWSMGNEVPEQRSETGREVAQYLTDIAHREDPTRLTTGGFDDPAGLMQNRVGDGVDFIGLNYKPHFYGKFRREYPEWLQFGSETASCVSSRGEYYIEPDYKRVPSGGKQLIGSAENLADEWLSETCEVPAKVRETLHCNSYDLTAPMWAYPPDVEFRGQDDHPYNMGEFVWTGFDYLGEPTPYITEWPSRSSYFGIYDLAGLPKDRAYLYESRWTDHRVLHLVPDRWNFAPGTHLPVHCYLSYDRAELFVNGRSFGVRAKERSAKLPMKRYRLIWEDVAFEPGELRVNALDEAGNVLDTAFLRTAGEPAKLELIPYRETVGAPGTDADLAYFTVRVTDENGVTCPDADTALTFEVTGGRFVGADNGDQTEMTSFASNVRRAFHGYAVACAEPDGSDELTLTVTAEGFAPVSRTLPVTVEAQALHDEGSTAELEILTHESEGYAPLMAHGGWRVALIRFREALRYGNAGMLERHTATDEVFLPISGRATLYIGRAETPVEMHPGKVYNVKRGAWHKIRMAEDAVVAVVENDDTGDANTEKIPARSV